MNFKIDYVNADGNISNYYPDFIVKTDDGNIFIVETKGLQDLDVPLKMQRLRTWCADMNMIQKNKRFRFIFVEEEPFEKNPPGSFAELISLFTSYQQ